MTERKFIEKDGVYVVESTEFQTYITQVKKSGVNTLAVGIPSEIVKHLHLTSGCVIQVAIKVISTFEAIKKFGYTTKHHSEGIQVKCPKCGKLGTATLGVQGSCFVYHGKKHGATKNKHCYISRKNNVSFYENMTKLRRVKSA